MASVPGRADAVGVHVAAAAAVEPAAAKGAGQRARFGVTEQGAASPASPARQVALPLRPYAGAPWCLAQL